VFGLLASATWKECLQIEPALRIGWMTYQQGKAHWDPGAWKERLGYQSHAQPRQETPTSAVTSSQVKACFGELIEKTLSFIFSILVSKQN
jgi:hypothetical protein